MNDSSNDFIRKIIGEFDKLSYISPEDVPDIALYMDQITTFMDSRLDACKRHPDDKILTKTMINNYTKSKLIPPPDKKTYLDISEKTGASTATISRVNRSLNYGNDGYPLSPIPIRHSARENPCSRSMKPHLNSSRARPTI